MEIAAHQSVLASRLSARGIRLTRQRRIVVDLIENAQDHLHASDILRLAREKDERMNRATVYRTLSMLKAEGLVDELDLLHLDGCEHHYEVRSLTNHIHIGCKRCGKILEFETALVGRLKDEIKQKTGCEVESVRVEVAALCRECRQTE
ncbi:MAG: Fur family transcriptional regulator [Armatimonadota bacterium]